MKPIQTNALITDQDGNICAVFGNKYIRFEQGFGKFNDGSEFQYLGLIELTEPVTPETKEWPKPVPGLPNIRLIFKNKEGIDIMIEQLRELRKHAESFDLLDQRVEDQDLPVRVLNCLRYAEIETVRELCRSKRADLLKFRNFGKRSLTELDEWMEKHNLQFGMQL